MESEKKPKRPRIGAIRTSFDSNDQENNYSQSSTSSEANPGGENQSESKSAENGFQRPVYQPYQRREGAYQPYQRREGNYQPRPNNGYNQNGYQPRQNNGYQPRGNGYGQPRQNNGYQQRGNGYGQPRQNNGYGQPRQNTGYNQRNNYNQNRQYANPQNGEQNSEQTYQPRPRNNYQPRQNNGYNQNGYQVRQNNGYQPRGNNGYQQRNNGYGQNRQNNGYGQNRNNNRNGYGQNRPQKMFTPRPKQIDYVIEDVDPNTEVRLNKYMANAGLCSRREADEYITNGLVKVNGEVVTELGVKITRNDVVEYDGKVVTPERKCYVLLNKPKDCVTTSDDPNGRLTVLDLVKSACQERIYPVGRLDRNTTGVLLLTNDGDLASKLTHPKFIKKKIYHVWTDKEISEEDMQRIADGIELEDGEIHADAISYVSDTDRDQAGIEIHSGRNRIVRRIFEHLGYRVIKLDRVYFAGLTKKNLPRGRWRYLTQEEVNFLRMGSFE